MEVLIVSLLLLPQDVVIEMNDGVREVKVGKAAVRVEVRNAGEEGSSAARPDPQQRWFHEEDLESTRLEEAWDWVDTGDAEPSETGGELHRVWTNGSSRSLSEVEILVPSSRQSCGQRPLHRWDFGRVKVESFDTPAFETLYELRKLRLPSDASQLKFHEGGREWVCRKGRPDPFKKKKKKPGIVGEELGIPAPDVFPLATSIVETTETVTWQPLLQEESMALPEFDELFEETGRFLPIGGLLPIRVGIGFPLEFYGVQGGVGLLRPWLSWEAGEAATWLMGGAVEVSTAFDSMAGSSCVSLGLLAGFGDVSLTFGQWTLDQRIRVSGINGGIPFDETTERELEMAWIGVDWSHPWLATDLLDSGGVRWIVDLRSALGAGVVSGSVDAVATPSVIGVAAAEEDRSALATVGAVLKSEVRLGRGWSISSSGRYLTGLGGKSIDLQQMAMVDVGVELRW